MKKLTKKEVQIRRKLELTRTTIRRVDAETLDGVAGGRCTGGYTGVAHLNQE